MSNEESNLEAIGSGDSIGRGDHSEKRSQEFEGGMNIEKCGPWGSPCRPSWKMELGDGETITQVIIRCGFIIDGIGFVVADKSGRSTKRWFGGSGGSCDKILLEPNEYITQISGRHGVYQHGCQRHIASIIMHTNFCPAGYGPYGDGRDTEKICHFSTPLPSQCAISGFFGRSGEYLDSIGVFIKKCDNGAI